MLSRPLAILLGTLICTTAVAQSLDERVRELERRVEQLEKKIGTQPAAFPGGTTGRSSGLRHVEDWRALRLGMTQADVRTALGEPHKIEVIGLITWYYEDGGSVRFDRRSGTVEGWSEPGR